MRILRVLSLFAALAAVSCRYPNEFKNMPSNATHAVSRGTTYSHAGSIFATHINGQPTSFWRSSDVFRIRAGTSVVHTAYSDRQETLSYKEVQFVAIAGRDYVLSRKQELALVSLLTATPYPTNRNAWVIHDRRDQVVIRERNTSGPDRVMAEAPKEGYVFGFSSPTEAIAGYRRKNP